MGMGINWLDGSTPTVLAGVVTANEKTPRQLSRFFSRPTAVLEKTFENSDRLRAFSGITRSLTNFWAHYRFPYTGRP